MKVLHIIDSGGLYGAETMLINLAVEQARMGIKTGIASIGESSIKEKPIEVEAIKKGLSVERFRMFPGPNLAGMMRVLRFARRNQFDVLHSHGYKSNVAFGFMPRKIRRLPLVATFHGHTSCKRFSKNRMYEWLDTLSLKYMNAVVVVSRELLSHPRLEKLEGVKWHVVENGIPIETLTRSFAYLHCGLTADKQVGGTLARFSCPESACVTDKEIIEFCERGFTVGSIGRLSFEKGYKYLIEAFGMLIRAGIDARLVILGEGNERKNLEDLVLKLGLRGRVKMPGYCEDAKRFLHHFDTYAISSLTEGLPLSLLQAMEARLPIVATAVGGIPRTLQDGQAGLVVQSGKPAHLFEGMKQLYCDRELSQTLAERAYKRVIESYSSSSMASQYLDVYRKVLNEPRPGLA